MFFFILKLYKYTGIFIRYTYTSGLRILIYPLLSNSKMCAHSHAFVPVERQRRRVFVVVGCCQLHVVWVLLLFDQQAWHHQLLWATTFWGNDVTATVFWIWSEASSPASIGFSVFFTNESIMPLNFYLFLWMLALIHSPVHLFYCH